jgi:3-hydroxybutyryl-CoA dehydrogenase
MDPHVLRGIVELSLSPASAFDDNIAEAVTRAAMTKGPVGVVGCGVIGRSLAQALAEKGVHVILVDTSERALHEGHKAIENQVRIQRLRRLGTMSAADVLDRVEFSTNLAVLERSAFIVENVTEDRQIKARVYEDLDSICASDCIFAANTSAIPIASIASLTQRPEMVVGMHFMNPVPQTRMVEIVRSPFTRDDVLRRALELVGTLEKEYVVVNDSPGFVVNRTLMLMIREAAATLQDGVAEAAEIDRLFRGCLGHRMGPLRTADLIGLDTVLRTLQVLESEFGGGGFTPPTLLLQLVQAERLGRKTGRGFFEYEDGD